MWGRSLVQTPFRIGNTMPRPLLIAHRGASADASENTLAAFALAHAQGAEMIELDVQQSADGVPVVFHDTTTERWDGRKRPTRSCTLAELQRLDIGGERVPTLAEVCAWARDTSIALNVELKHAGMAHSVATLLHQHRLTDSTIVSSFDGMALDEMYHHAPHIWRGYIMGKRTLWPHIRARELWPFFHLKRVQARSWHPNYRLPLLRFVLPLARRAGYAVYVWTVDDPATIQTMLDWGVCGVMTNAPAVARDRMPPDRGR